MYKYILNRQKKNNYLNIHLLLKFEVEMNEEENKSP